MKSDPTLALERVRAALKAADEGNYPSQGLFYVSRDDVEALVTEVDFHRQAEDYRKEEHLYAGC